MPSSTIPSRCAIHYAKDILFSLVLLGLAVLGFASYHSNSVSQCQTRNSEKGAMLQQERADVGEEWRGIISTTLAAMLDHPPTGNKISAQFNAEQARTDAKLRTLEFKPEKC